LSGGSQIRVAGGVQPNAVLYHIIGDWGQVVLSGGGGGTGCCKAIVDGTLLAPNRTPLARPRERAGDFGPGHQHRVRVQRALPVPDAVTRVTGRGV